MKTSLVEQILVLWQNWPGMAWVGIASLALGGWLIVAKTLRSKLGDWLRYWLVAMLEPLDQWFHTQMARRHSLRAYCLLCLQDIRYQQLYVPAAAGKEIKLDVDRTFVTLRLEHAGGARKWYDHGSLLQLGSRIRVVGDPGSGKSSLIRRMLRDACMRARLELKAAQLPILLELRTLKLPKEGDNAKALGQWLWECLRASVVDQRVFKPAECFDAYANGPGLLVLGTWQWGRIAMFATRSFHQYIYKLNEIKIKLFPPKNDW